MLISRKVTFFFFLFLVSFSLLLRFLRLIESGGEEGQDSWDYHQMVAQIANSGKINWLLHPLSLFGHYPPWQEMGVITFTTVIYLVSGLPFDFSIFVESFFIGTVSIFFSFIFVKEITRDNLTPIIVAAFFCFANKIVLNTSTGISIRDFFAICLMFYGFIFFRMIVNFDSRYLSLFLFSSFILFTIHRFSIMLSVLAMVLFLTLLVNLYRKYVLRNIALNFGNRNKSIYVLLLFGFFYISYNQIIIDHSYSPSSPYYLSIGFFGSVVELSIVYSYKFGIPLVFAPLGIFALLSKNKLRTGDIFLLFGFIFVVIFVFDTTYIINLQFFIMTTICGMGFRIFATNLKRSLNPATSISVVFLFILSSSLAPHFVGGPANLAEGYQNHERWLTGHYCREKMVNENLLLTSYGISGSAVQAIAERPFWRDTEIDTIESIVASEINTDNFIKSRTLYSTEIDYSPRQLYIEGFDIDSIHVQSKIGEAKLYYLVNNNFNEKSYSSPYESDLETTPEINKLVESFIDDRFVIYESENHSIFFIQ